MGEGENEEEKKSRTKESVGGIGPNWRDMSGHK